MKNLLQIKNFKHRLGWLAAFVSLLFMSQGALATTYYVYGGTNQGPMQNSYLGTTTSDSYTWTQTFYTGNNYYIIFTTTQSNTENDLKSYAIYCTTGAKSSDFSAAEANEYSGIKSLRFAVSSQLSSMTVTLSGVSGTGSSSSSTYTVSTGSSCSNISVSCSVTNGTTSSTNPQCIVAGNSASFTITPSSGYEMPSSVTYSGTSDAPVISGTTVTVSNIQSAGTLTVTCKKQCTYYIKHGWYKDSKNDWSWQQMSDSDGDGIFTLEAYYGGTGCNINTKNEDSGAAWYASPTLVGEPANGDYCIFSFEPDDESTDECPTSDGTVTITKKPYSWYLAGEFTSWDTNKIEFTGTGNTLTCTKVFDALTSYTGCTAAKGFKIVRKIASNEWIGIDCNTITKSNKTVTFDKDKTNDANTCGFTPDGPGEYTFTLDITDPDKPELTVSYPVAKLLPIVRIGEKTSENSTTFDVTVSAYLARTGCSDLTKFTVYYSKNSFTTGTESDVYIRDFTQSSAPTINTLYPLVLNGTTLQSEGWGDGDYLYVRVSGTNTTGESELSDIDSIQFKCEKEFTVINIEKNFTACETGHQFDISEMVTPTPDNVTVTATSASASDSDFKIKNGVATWSITGKETGTTYTYTFTFTRDGYPEASGTVTVNYTEIQPTGTIAITTPAVDGTNTSPWTAVALEATVTGDAFNSVKWTVSPSGLLIDNGYNTSTGKASATFKGKAPSKATQLYTVTVQGLSASCGASTDVRTFIVNKDEEDCTEE